MEDMPATAPVRPADDRCSCATTGTPGHVSLDPDQAHKPFGEYTTSDWLLYYRWAAHRLAADADLHEADTDPKILARWRKTAADFELLADSAARSVSAR